MSNLNYKIIDNALLENDARVIVDSMEHGSFPWYYNKSIAYGKKDLDKKITEEKEVGGYFNHLFYSNYSILSQDFEKLWPILRILNPKAIIRIKGNMYLNRYNGEVNKHPSHVDYDFSHTGAIYYCNTNDGFTILEDGTKVESIFNRLLIFDASKPHSSTDCSNSDYRMNINFNYFI